MYHSEERKRRGISSCFASLVTQSRLREGSPIQLMGLDITPPRLPRENIKEEISRYARNDRALSPRNVVLRGLSFPSSNSTHKGFKVFSGVSWEGGLFPLPNNGKSFALLRTTITGGGMSPLLQLHPELQKSYLRSSIFLSIYDL